jgi:hypothetical protein
MPNKTLNMPRKRGRKTKKNNTSLGKKSFNASSKYVDVSFITNSDGKSINITARYKDLNGVSAIHIHNNNNGSPGPILAWLGTTEEWQQGVTQNTPGKNCPCCNNNNPLCTLAAPKGTPKIMNLSKSKKYFNVKNKSCNKSCPWIQKGTFLVIHGFNFQRVENGELTKENPGLDVIAAIPFL